METVDITHLSPNRQEPTKNERESEEVEVPLFTRSRPMMGTVFLIKVEASPEQAQPAINDAFVEIERLERVLSEWRDDSEISKINQNAGQRAVQVSSDVFTVIKAGVDVSRWSNGAFDLSWAAMRGIYDFRPGQQRIPVRSDVRRRVDLIDWKHIALNEEERTVFLKREGMAIGTGGIGKGYALDRAGAILRRAGIQNYMLFAGGQVQVHGRRNSRAWRVGIQHPRQENIYFAFFESEGGSISTSGDYEHFFIDENGKRWHHILNPKTGLPAEKSISVTLMAPSGLYADALSTASFVLGPEKALEMFEQIPYQAEAILLDKTCALHARPSTLERLTLRVTLQDNRIPNCESN